MADKAPIAGQKIKRKFMGNFIDSALPGTKETAYVRLGKDLEEYNVEMNANVDTKNNILGETSVTLDSYHRLLQIRFMRLWVILCLNGFRGSLMNVRP